MGITPGIPRPGGGGLGDIPANTALGNFTNATALPTAQTKSAWLTWLDAATVADLNGLSSVVSSIGAGLTSLEEVVASKIGEDALVPYLLQSTAAATYVPRSGGTMTGALVVPDLVVGGIDGPRLNRSGMTIRARSNDGLSDAPFSAGSITASGNINLTTANSTQTFTGDGNIAASRLFLRPNGGPWSTGVQVLPASAQTAETALLVSLSGIFAGSTGAAGVQRSLVINPTYQQSGTAGSTDLHISRTETTLGAGEHNFINCLTSTTSRFRVDRLGNVFFGNTLYRTDGSTGLGTSSLANIWLAINGTQLLGSGNANEVVVRQASVLGFSNTSSNVVSGYDAGIGRDSAGVLQVCTTSNNALGSLNLNNITASGTGQFAGVFASGGQVELTGSVSGSTGNGALRRFAANTQIWANGSFVVYRGGSEWLVGSDKAFGFSSGTLTSGASAAAGDVLYFRDGPGISAQRNGTNGQISRIYNTFTSTTNLRALQLDCTDANNIRIGSLVGSSGGTALGLQFGTTNAAGAWASWLGIDANGNVTGSGGSITLFTTIATTTTGVIRWHNRTRLTANLDGLLGISNSAGSSFAMLDIVTDSSLTLWADAGRSSLKALACGTITSAFQSLSADPSTIDLAAGMHRVVKNTTSGEVRDWVNDGGVMKKSPAYT